MSRLKEKWLCCYSYVIPTLITLTYIIYILYHEKHNMELILLQDCEGFDELCKSIANFTSIVLGIYGFFIPVIIGRMEEKYVKRFWELIDRDIFSKDMKKIMFGGMVTILLSAGLLVNDFFPGLIKNLGVIIFIWVLFFFTCSSYRFIGIFIQLVVGKEVKGEAKPKIKQTISDDQKLSLDANMDDF